MELPLNPPAAEHVQFDRLCEEVDEFETLPNVRPADALAAESEDESPLDGQILAGLVSPY